ncbi:MAG: hypothetical protein HYR80_10320, partial [Nitrospirae bacterium]|nr:hypothetical protein [Nitrospirota bacterium]
LATVVTGTPPGPPPTLIYSANGSANNVSVIDPATNAITATVSVGTNPLALAPTPDGKLVIVVNGGGTVSVITRSSQTVTATLTLPDPVTGTAAAIAGPAGTNLVYIANHNAMKIYVMNTQSNTITATIPVGAPAVYSPQGPLDLVISPDGSTLYANVDVNPGDPANADGYIAVISTASNSSVGRINLPMMNGAGTYHTGGSHVAMNPLGGFAYASADPYVVIIDTVANGVITSLKIPTSGPKCYSMSLGVTADGTALAASCWNTLFLYDTSLLIQTMNTGQNLSAIISSIAITGDSAKGYLAGNSSSSITNLDLTNLSLIGGITVPAVPTMIAASPAVINVPGGSPIVLTAPDLTFTALSANATVNLSVASNLTITGTAKNIGGSAAASFVISYYLSPTNFYNSATAISIGSQTVGSLGAGATLNLNSPFTVPTSVPLGDYYVLANADANQQIAENNEDNNIFSTATKVHLVVVDLAETNLTSPAIGTGQLPGATISVTDTVTNPGTASVGTFPVGIYLNPVSGGKYTFLGSRSVSSLAVGGTSTGTKSYTIPTNVVGGTYNLQAVADYANAVPESNETNNTFTNTSGLITIPPADLVMTAVSTTATTVARGGAVTISYTVKNQGIGGTAVFAIGFYLSTDSTITTADKYLSYKSISPGLNPGASISGSVTMVIPANTTPGTYYLGAYADYLNVVIESVETNNGKATAGTIQVQ